MVIINTALVAGSVSGLMMSNSTLRYSDLASKCNNRSAVYCVRPCYLCVQLPWSLEHVLQSSIIIGDSFL